MEHIYYVTYLPKEGNKLPNRCGTCLSTDFGKDLGDGSIWIESNIEATIDNCFIDNNNELCFYTEEQLLNKFIKPNYYNVWDIDLLDWVDPRGLAEKQTHKWEEIKQIRAQKEFSPFTWDNSEFDADSESQRRIQGASQLAMIAAGANQSFSIDWTLADNTVRTLSGADMISVGLALGTHVATQYEIARTLRTAIEATTTEEELNNIVWPSVASSSGSISGSADISGAT